MSSDHLDTIDTTRDLEATGIARPHAEAIARAVGRTGEQLATKADCERHEAATRADFKRHETATKVDFKRHESSTKVQFERHEAATDSKFERFESAIRADIANLRAEMCRASWMQGAGIVTIVVALELLR